jgi:hypothetical protein
MGILMLARSMIFVAFAAATEIAIVLALFFSEIGRALEPQNSTIFGPHCSNCSAFTFFSLIPMLFQLPILAVPIFFLALLPIAVAGISFSLFYSVFNVVPIWAPIIVAPLCGLAFWFEDNILLSGPDQFGNGAGMFRQNILAYCWTTFFFFISFYVVLVFGSLNLRNDAD